MLSNPRLSWRYLILTFAALSLLACGGGSGGGAGSQLPAIPQNQTPPEPEPRIPATPPTAAELSALARFASRASFGLSFAELEGLATRGPEAWLQAQFSASPGFHQPAVRDLVLRREAGEFDEFEEDIEYLLFARRMVWWDCAVRCADQLRQRVAFALSEIFVVSDNVDQLLIDPFALSNYYDTLLEHAFGNYRDLLRAVALHPAMGFYLSHVNNSRSNPDANTFPDENFAREVMQLFAIGLHRLNPDGSVVFDTDRRPVPTYDNDDIREFAKVFTGLSYGGPEAFFGNPMPNFSVPMQMFDEHHEPGSKNLLEGAVVADGLSAIDDVEAALDNLFNHPNVGPFIGKQLIQRLVTSNPSPAYIERVTAVFEADSLGVRGNLQEVIAAILTDEEALADSDPLSHFGKLREPVLRYLNLLRVFGARSDDGFIANTGYLLQFLSRQHPLSSPSVFNFFLPAHSPTGDIAAADLVAPEFQIVDSFTIVNMVNLLDLVLFAEQVTDAPPPFAPVSLQLAEWESLSEDLDLLLERLDIVLTHGTLSDASRSVIRGVLADVPNDAPLRVLLAIYMVMMSPDYVVEL